ncbi:hypothetical protein [Chromobacterium sinusclupearum]|nr:hypothetical protein [Chromobacterium sinusclupearum]
MATAMDFELKDVFDLDNQPSAEELRNQVIRPAQVANYELLAKMAGALDP